MGLLNFIKEVGETVRRQRSEGRDRRRAEKGMDKHGLSAEGLDISVDGDKVTVKGSAASTEAAEKIVLALGSTVGVAQVDNQLQTAQAAPAAVMYTVQKGDTLWKIAEANYGKGKGAKYPTISRPTSPCSATRTRSTRARCCAFRRLPSNNQDRPANPAAFAGLYRGGYPRLAPIDSARRKVWPFLLRARARR